MAFYKRKYHHSGICRSNTTGTNNTNSLSFKQVSHKPVKSRQIQAIVKVINHLNFSWVSPKMQQKRPNKLISWQPHRLGSHPSYKPALINSSASTILLAAAKEREAASSAVVSVSTPCTFERWIYISICPSSRELQSSNQT